MKTQVINSEEYDTSDFTATYSPEDNKLRLYCAYRLDPDLYNRVKSAGFKWAPKQDLFVAPMWTPGREDLLIELAGEIGDEDTSLVDRAESRADRFEDYSSKRAEDANRAHAEVKGIADNIPLGQPILVGHHSERRARRYAQKIENGIRKAVKMWKTSEYWKDRAAGAIRHAKYKERPDVRARRIKKIESSRRKAVKAVEESRMWLNHWFNPMTPFTKKKALAICNYSHLSFNFKLDKYPRDAPKSQYEGPQSLWSALDGGIINARQARNLAVPVLKNIIAVNQRWIRHYDNRLVYEKDMLQEGGGLKADQFDFKVGGQVKHRWGWSVIARVNKKAGVVCSLSLFSKSYPSKVQVEEVLDYSPPSAEDEKKAKTATILPPLCNYKREGFAIMTKAEYAKQYKDHKGTKIIHEPGFERHRVRTIQGFIGRQFGGEAKNSWENIFVFLSDQKGKQPAPEIIEEKVEIPKAKTEPPRAIANNYTRPERTDFDEMKDTLKNGGVKIVSAPQLFPTPKEIAEQMADVLDVKTGESILEPSAGTGVLIEAVINSGCKVVAVEINNDLCDAIRKKFPEVATVQADFLELNGDKSKADKIIMNPPFIQGSDIKHIQHALTFLKPGGRLVALCANGPRQQKVLKPLAEESVGTWAPLPEGSFQSKGTNVNVAMMVYEKG